jgi:hypothetical protein
MEINDFELIWGAMPTFACKGRAEDITSVTRGGFRGQVKARDHSNMKQECYPLDRVFRNIAIFAAPIPLSSKWLLSETCFIKTVFAFLISFTKIKCQVLCKHIQFDCSTDTLQGVFQTFPWSDLLCYRSARLDARASDSSAGVLATALDLLLGELYESPPVMTAFA